MKRELNKNLVFPVLAAAFLLLAYPPPIQSCNPAAGVLHSLCLNLENTDQDHPLGDVNEFKVFGSNDGTDLCSPESEFLIRFFSLPLEDSSRDQMAVVLRR